MAYHLSKDITTFCNGLPSIKLYHYCVQWGNQLVDKLSFPVILSIQEVHLYNI